MLQLAVWFLTQYRVELVSSANASPSLSTETCPLQHLTQCGILKVKQQQTVGVNFLNRIFQDFWGNAQAQSKNPNESSRKVTSGFFPEFKNGRLCLLYFRSINGLRFTSLLLPLVTWSIWLRKEAETSHRPGGEPGSAAHTQGKWDHFQSELLSLGKMYKNPHLHWGWYQQQALQRFIEAMTRQLLLLDFICIPTFIILFIICCEPIRHLQLHKPSGIRNLSRWSELLNWITRGKKSCRRQNASTHICSIDLLFILL